MRRVSSIACLLGGLTLVAAGCGSASSPAQGTLSPVEQSTVPEREPNSSEPSDTETEPTEPTVADEPDEKDSGEPAPPSRRTDISDIDLLGPDDPGDFPRAAVPVDAYAAVAVLVEPEVAEVDATVAGIGGEGDLVIPVEIETCTLVGVWALPHPGEVVVGYEEHPNIDCVRSVPRTAVFVIPAAGENSEGEWTYEDTPEVVLQRRKG